MKEIEFYNENEIKEFIKNYEPFEGYRCGLKPFDDLLRIDLQMLTTLVAVPCNGKSTFINYYSYLMNRQHGWKTLYWCFETEVDKQYAYLSFLYGKDFKQMYEQCLIPKTPLSTWDDFKNMIICAANAGAKLIILDNFTCMKRFFDGNSEYTEIDKKISELVELKKQTNTAILLVVHPTKQGKNDTFDDMDGYSCKGSTGFYDLSDFVFSLKADKDNFLTKIKVLKVRDDDKGREGSCYLNFDPITKKYSELKENEEEKITTFKNEFEQKKAIKKAMKKAIKIVDDDEEYDVPF